MRVLEELALMLKTNGDAEMSAAMASTSHAVDHLVDHLKTLVVGYLSVEFWKTAIEGTVAMGVELVKLSEKTGIAVEDLSRLQYAASLSETSSEDLTTGLRFLSRAMQGVNMDTGLASKGLKTMGIEAVDPVTGKQRELVDVLFQVADKFATYKDGAAKAALAMDIFGRSGTAMIPFLNQGREGIRNLMEESDRLGNTMSAQAAHEMKAYEDSIKRLHGWFNSLARAITLWAIAPLKDLADEFTDSSEAMKGFVIVGEAVHTILSVIGTLLAEVGDAVVGFTYIVIDLITLAAKIVTAPLRVLAEGWTKTKDGIVLTLDDLKESFGKTIEVMKQDAVKGAKSIEDIWTGAPPKLPKIGTPKPGEDGKGDAPLIPPPPPDTKKAWEDFVAFQKAVLDRSMQQAEIVYNKKHALAEDETNDYKKYTQLDTEASEEFYATQLKLAQTWAGMQLFWYGQNSKEFQDAMKDLEKIQADHDARDDKIAEERRKRFLKRLSDNSKDMNEMFREVQQRASELGSVAANAVESAFGALFEKGGGITASLKAFAGTILQGIGGIFTRMGETAIAASPIITAIATALKTLSGPALLAAGIGLVALGATLGAIGGRIGNAGFTPNSGSNAYAGVSPATIPSGATRWIFGENSAATAAGMTPRQAVNVTVIGPNDSVAQRQIMELITKAQRRGNV